MVVLVFIVCKIHFYIVAKKSVQPYQLRKNVYNVCHILLMGQEQRPWKFDKVKFIKSIFLE